MKKDNEKINTEIRTVATSGGKEYAAEEGSLEASPVVAMTYFLAWGAKMFILCFGLFMGIYYVLHV